jgi:phospholipase C
VGAVTLKPLPDEDRRASGFVSLAYYTEKHTPYLWNVADEYVLFDHYFSSSIPNQNAANWNRMFLVAGSTGDLKRIPVKGYDAVTTVFDRLEAAGISWKFYIEKYSPEQNFHAIADGKPAPSQLVRVPLLSIPRFVDDPKYASHIVDLSEYYTDLSNGTLPAVTYIVAKGAGETSDKALMLNQRHLKTVMQELLRSRYWPESALFWTHDQTDGWYDHVAPPTLGGDPGGARVPAMLISAYARRGRIDSTVLEHSSVLKFIEYNWSLEPLTGRTASANTFLDAFSFDAPPRAAVFMPMSRVTTAKPVEPKRFWIFRLYGSALGLALLTTAPLLWITAARGIKTVQIRRTARVQLVARVEMNQAAQESGA